MAKLAIDGGQPVRDSLLPYAHQVIDDDDERAVISALRGHLITTGPAVDRFEKRFAERVGARFAVAVSSGTAALHAAMFAADVGPCDEVVVPTMTFAASSNAVRYQGGKVVFVDVREDTLNVNLDLVRKAVNSNTRAIVAVDYAGHPAVTEELQSFARSRRIRLIEDASHSLGAKMHGRAIGSIADLTTFSFHPVKHITTGEGGMITTDDPELAKKLYRFRNHGITSTHAERENSGSWYYEMVDLGYNYRITDIQCALGLSQLSKLERWVSRRRAIAARLTARLTSIDSIRTPMMHPGAEPSWHLYPIRLRLELLRADRTVIFRALRAENIGVSVHYIPVPWHPYYQKLGYRKGQWPVSEQAYHELISLPMFPAMTDDDVDDVVTALEKVLSVYKVEQHVY